MRISHKHKFVFIAVTKTASSSIRSAIYNFVNLSPTDFGEDVTPHITSVDLKKKFIEKGWDWDEYFKFVFVRNPWDRIVSQFEYKRKYIETHIVDQLKKGDRKYNFTQKLLNFRGFLDHLVMTNENKDLYLKQVDWIFDKNKKNLVDFVGRFENLQEDFNIVCDKIGIPHRQLPHQNKTHHKHYTEYYDDETRSIVAEKYAKDIEYFGYEFGE